ncbi:MAG: transglutaminase family protein, partial [Xanthomonadales bacterium]|nr:transglutaminase family protein [Xanthomonadales bacterium]
WRRREWLQAPGEPGEANIKQVRAFGEALTQALGLPTERLLAAHEDPLPVLAAEVQAPVNLDPLSAGLEDPLQRQRLREQLRGGLTRPTGFVLPLHDDARKQGHAWRSSAWPLRQGQVFLLAGDSPMGYRLPLGQLPHRLPEEIEDSFATDPFAPRAPLGAADEASPVKDLPDPDPREVVRTCLCLELRQGRLHVFLPPLNHLEAFVELLRRLEQVASQSKLPLVLEGYLPPSDPRLQRLAVTPDPGVLEINIHPASDWDGLVERFEGLYAAARECRLGADKFMLDGRHEGTGGGNHVTLGGVTPSDSPLLRRPALLRSLLVYWQNHPSLSYLFSGAFVGPTSQAPRVDEARDDNLYELAIALEQLDAQIAAAAKDDEVELPWQLDRILRNFLVDLTGNTHRSEFCIDKLYPPSGARLGLLELRAFEMPPHPRMALLQLLLLRGLVAWFWQQPWRGSLIEWGGALHDRFMLPQLLEQDFLQVLSDLRHAGMDFDPEWFSAFFEFRFPRLGSVQVAGSRLELRQAIEPWPVLGEEMSATGTARYVDSSVERLQVRIEDYRPERQRLLCNGRPLPLVPVGSNSYVAGLRFRAWSPWSARHPTLTVDAPLRFDLVDLASGRSVGGCTYHVSHPGGRNYQTRPVNALEAEARRRARFFASGHHAGPLSWRPERVNPRSPLTLDLRRQPEHGLDDPANAQQ